MTGWDVERDELNVFCWNKKGKGEECFVVLMTNCRSNDERKLVVREGKRE